METTDALLPLTRDRIRALLQAGPTGPTAEYERLMEVYCVAKAGGIATQVAVAQRLEETETAVLLTEIEAIAAQPDRASRVQALQQEIEELKRSVADRVDYLSALDPQALAVVESCLSEMDAHFASQRRL